MILLKNANLYNPEHMGIVDILIEGNKILQVGNNIEITGIDKLDIYDCLGKIVTPGFVDLHTHILGGGGEDGPTSMVPEPTVSQFFKYGITTTLGLLGTDGIIRNPESLLIKAKALNEEGLTCKVLVGSYKVPSRTITESIEKDIVLFNEVIGTKVALSNHRGSNPSKESLIDLFTQTRRAGLLSKKAGLITLHMGRGKRTLKDVFEILESTDIPIKNILPTHMGFRGEEELLEDGIKYINMGGTIDISARETSEDNLVLVNNMKYILSKTNESFDNLTVSSDAFGSLPKFDGNGNCIGLTYATPIYNNNLLKELIKNDFTLSCALKFFTKNPARVMGLEKSKGQIKEGFDADILIKDDNHNIESVITLGEFAIKENVQIKKGRFE